MVNEKIRNNAEDLEQELAWFAEVLKARAEINAGQGDRKDVYHIPVPDLENSASEYGAFVRKHKLDFDERFALVMAIASHIRPQLLDVFIQRNEKTEQNFTEFGGKTETEHAGFTPTGETLSFILAGNALDKRFALHRLFSGDHLFAKKNILWLSETEKGEPVLKGALRISQEMLDLFTTGEVRKPHFSSEFPAKILITEMDWDDLVLSPALYSSFAEIEAWLLHNRDLMQEWGMRKKLKPGYKVLFYGPPGTGKSITAALIGKKTGREVYKIDLSKTVSKYIGDTEKNLALIFDKAENTDWILFFDEADALFGKRTNVNDAHDRYANQEVSYLLQRIEDYPGLVILSSNLKNNIDTAFARRFQAVIPFSMPRYEERLLLWEKSFSPRCTLESKIDLTEIARSYELAGGSIINVVQYCSLMALKRKDTLIMYKDMMEGIRREFHKSGRTI